MATFGDNPIRDPSDDALGRNAVARDLAAEIAAADVSEGCVVGVMGPWGSGKTSLINLIRHELSSGCGTPVLDFNPWMFSGAEQLVESFFRELAAQLRIREGRLGQVASELEAYGDLLAPIGIVPVVGPWVSRFKSAASAFRKFQERRKESVTGRRDKLTLVLNDLEQHIIMVVDDLDRLQTSEIRDIFKLVRLTASFPNIIYVLAFDRARIEDALTETGVNGRSYLEKIVQISVDIPAIPDGLLLNQLARTLDTAFGDLGGPLLFDETRWVDILAEIVRPHIRNMRDVRRYAASIRGTVRALNGQVDLSDLLGLEAVRVFAPDLFAAIVKAQDALTRTESHGIHVPEDSKLRQLIERLLEAAVDRDLGHAIMYRLFPAGLRYIDNTHYGPEWQKDWMLARRVAHSDVLKLYLERIANARMEAFTDAERAFALMGDEEAFDAYLRSVDIARREDVIASLENYEGTYPKDTVPHAVVVLLNLMPDLPTRNPAFFGPDTRLVVDRVVLRMLRQIEDAEQVERVVDEVMPRIPALSSRLELVRMVGHEKGAGHRLVTEEFASVKESEFLELVASGSVDLSDVCEWSLFRVLLWTKKRDAEYLIPRAMADNRVFEVNRSVIVVDGL